MVKYFNGILVAFVQKNTKVNNDGVVKWSVVADFTGPEPDAVYFKFICQVKGDEVGAFCNGKASFDASLDIAYPRVHIPLTIQVIDVKIGGSF